MKQSSFKRVILIVCDSVGIGQAPDAADFNDEGSDTLGHIAQWCRDNNKTFRLPELCSLGLKNLVPELGPKDAFQSGFSASMSEISKGKDTTTGHWEIAGTPLEEDFSYFPDGFPLEFLEQWTQDNALPGYLCNQAASGTQVIEEYGMESIESGKPIVYTSADSVFQIAAHEESFGLERLYQICESARKMLDPLRVGRVIARPFLGDSPKNFQRTAQRKDFSYPPPEPNLMDLLCETEHFVASVGKIDDIFAHRSLTHKNHTGNTEKSQEAVLDFCQKLQDKKGLIFANFIDFDQLYGHRRDPWGYAQALMNFDAFLPQLYSAMNDEDLLIITADHGNDPTFRGSDHTREKVPLLIYSKKERQNGKHLGDFTGFHHVAKLCLESLGLEEAVSKLPQRHPCQSLFQKMKDPSS